jgi:galactokinase
MDTGKKRTLSSSVYNERVAEVSVISDQLKSSYQFRQIAQLEPQLLKEAMQELEDDLLKKRLRHIVTEEQRVSSAVEALQSRDMAKLGQLMNESHESLAHDYEVTGEELDTITRFSRRFPGVAGSRMTGAGFGGCAISLVESDRVNEHKRQVGENYFAETGLKASFHLVEANQGAGYWSL